MGRKHWRSLGDALQAMELYNGLGYQRYHPETPCPYLWAGTSLYQRGKYVADGKWSATAADKQLGCAAILKRLLDRGVDLPFSTANGKPLAELIQFRVPHKEGWHFYPAVNAIAGESSEQYLLTFEIRGGRTF